MLNEKQNELIEDYLNDIHFSDIDLYSFSICHYYRRYYPNVTVQYIFVDRNNTVYTQEFVDLLNRCVKRFHKLGMTAKEISGLKICSPYFQEEFFTFLSGIYLDASEVHFYLDDEGHLVGYITGPSWRTVFWEQHLLAMISELWHIYIKDYERYDFKAEMEYSVLKVKDCLEKGVRFCDMGTRRRYSRKHQWNVIKTMLEYQIAHPDEPGKFFGTSNVWMWIKLQEMYKNIEWFKCIGTMAHQVISLEAAFSGPVEANRMVMEKWRLLYGSYLGCYLMDCFGSDIFYYNMSLEFARAWDSYRIDSGDNKDEFDKLLGHLEGYESKFIQPEKIGCVFSNGLTIGWKIKEDNTKVWVNEDAELHEYVGGRMDDSYGNGTTVTCGLLPESGIKPCNIVIKMWKCGPGKELDRWCIKTSCDFSKAVGHPGVAKAYCTLISETVSLFLINHPNRIRRRNNIIKND